MTDPTTAADRLRSRITAYGYEVEFLPDLDEALAEAAAPYRTALEDVVRQFGYWTDSAGGLLTGGLSALEEAFDLLGWDDPHPMPDMRCDEPGCMRQISTGWPTRPGGTGPNGGYRRTCGEHYQLLQREVGDD